jgi:hypothetical protein
MNIRGYLRGDIVGDRMEVGVGIEIEQLGEPTP